MILILEYLNFLLKCLCECPLLFCVILFAMILYIIFGILVLREVLKSE